VRRRTLRRTNAASTTYPINATHIHAIRIAATAGSLVATPATTPVTKPATRVNRFTATARCATSRYALYRLLRLHNTISVSWQSREVVLRSCVASNPRTVRRHAVTQHEFLGPEGAHGRRLEHERPCCLDSDAIRGNGAARGATGGSGLPCHSRIPHDLRGDPRTALVKRVGDINARHPRFPTACASPPAAHLPPPHAGFPLEP
jgi:hypothetical protein